MHTVSNAIALHEMAALSNSVLRDELTGLLNRRGFLEEAPQLIEKQPANHYVLTLRTLKTSSSSMTNMGRRWAISS